MKYAPSPNFAFLAESDPRLVAAPTSAERALSIDDAVGALVHLRRFGEHLAQNLAAELGVYQARDVEQIERLKALRRRGIDENVLRMFHALRQTGNRATHDGLGTQSDAFHHLKIAHQLAIWFYRTVQHAPGFQAPALVPPPKLIGETEELRREIEELNAEAEAREAERDEAQEAMQTELRRRVGAEAAAQKLQEERDFFEAYASEQEALRAKNAAALEAARARIAELEARANAQVAERQTAVERAPAAVADATLEHGKRAAAIIELDEAATRELIDEQLREVGWEAHSSELRYGNGARPQKGRNLAIAEWPTANGPADYVLFCGLQAVGVVEAKRGNKDVASVLEQSKRYAEGLSTEPGVELGGPWGAYRVPFLFAANGRPYLEQLRTKSGIWFLDARRKTNLARPLHQFPTPEGLRDRLKQDIEAAHAKLAREPTGYLQLRDYQVKAIRAVEEGIARGQSKLLVAMATGTGKTRTAIGLVYRLLKAGRFRRVLFLVDRTALGEQTTNAFNEVEIEDLQTFGRIFDVAGMDATRPDPTTRVHISTVQSMVRRIFGESLETTPKIDDYDCVIVDECHRGYGLDQELTEAELGLAEYGIRSQSDYISKYRRVLEHFDAVKIGLTATPAKHTAAIFGRPIFQYSYREAVIDGYLIDHEPPISIVSKLAAEGIHLDKGEQVRLFDPSAVTVDLVELEDEVELEVESFNRRVINDNFNRVVCEELARHIDPNLPEKTLIFAATDLHADQVVDQMKRAFQARYGEVEDDTVVKITATADKPLRLIRHFKNEQNPKVVVTVDLLTTGIDVPKICNLVFLRRVKSRILYEQMIGRATRLCEEIGKETFRIFDAVRLYEALQDVTDMKPVVTRPNVGFGQLLEELELAVTGTDDSKAQQEVLDQLIAKLQRTKRRLQGEALERFRATSGLSPDELGAQLRQQSPAEALAYLKENDVLLKLLTVARTPQPLLLSDAHDEIQRVERGYGRGQKPQDYLEAFAAFIHENINKLPALTVVAQRPRDLTRRQLRELELELSTRGFTEANLRTAWSEAKNEDVAASVVGFIRQAALGDPLRDYDERVDLALKKLMTRHSFTRVQKQWLERIGKALKQDTVVDRDALDQGRFASDGGFRRFDKIFDGKLEALLAELREGIWESSAS